jgi:hypothetical protein
VADLQPPFSTVPVKKVRANVLKPRTTVLLTCLHLNGVMHDKAVQFVTPDSLSSATLQTIRLEKLFT